MKKSLLFFLFLATSLSAQDEVTQNEVTRMDQLIQATESSLARLKNVRTKLVEYKKAENKAVKDPKDTDNLLKLVNLAKELQTDIDEGALEDYFTPQFLEELKKFAQISDKKNIPQAK
ncbi:MAG: hypothetical protein JSR37_07095 [Verrucomicrobia bacterium]|nr:hypothetical protein [Verrucomicrobiota bacterium]MBS0637300.1 hypothetical protein [Verrucomicrobiota bacterium]